MPYLTAYHQSFDEEEEVKSEDERLRITYPPGCHPEAYPGSYLSGSVAAYHAYLASISRGGFGPPLPKPSGVRLRIKDCLVCGIRNSHINKHVL